MGESCTLHRPNKTTLSGGFVLFCHLPPHARGTLLVLLWLWLNKRDHPRMRGECALLAMSMACWVGHPRIRGEYVHSATFVVYDSGSPPHARGIHKAMRNGKHLMGITPACAGNTEIGSPGMALAGDHPRMRGEHKGKGKKGMNRSGTPPHTRGIQGFRSCQGGYF